MNSPLSVNLNFSRINRVPFFGTRYQSEQDLFVRWSIFDHEEGWYREKFINLFAPLAHDLFVESYEGWEGFLYAELSRKF